MQRSYNTPNQIGPTLNQLAYPQPQPVFNNLHRRPLDPNHLPNAIAHQRLNDASQRSRSPSVPGPAYNVNSVIPAKRSRPGEDGNDLMSPRAMPNQFSTSRSHTPSQATYGQPPNAYQHLQHPHQNGISPSPTAQQFASPGRIPTSNDQALRSTMSPASNMAMNNNPLNRSSNQSPMDHNAAKGSTQRPPGSQPDSILEQQQIYRQQLEKQRQQFASDPSRSAIGSINPTSNIDVQQATNAHGNRLHAQNQMSMRMSNQMQAQHPALLQKQRQGGEESFIASVSNYLNARGQSLEPNPRVCGRDISYHSLFMTVNTTRVLLPGPSYDNWELVAAHLGYSPVQFPQAVNDLKAVHERNLLGFTKDWMSLLQKRKLQQMQPQQQQQAQSSHHQGTQFDQDATRSNDSFSPPTIGQPNGQTQPPQPEVRPYSVQHHALQQASNGQNTPPPAMNKSLAEHDQGAKSAALKRQSSPEQPFGNSHPSRPSSSRAPSRAQEVDSHINMTPDLKLDVKSSKVDGTMRAPSPQTGKDPDVYYCRKRDILDGEDPYHGGLPIDRIARYGEILAQERPGMPRLDEMGVIDLHALTMSLESGIHGEMRYALDHLVNLSYEVRLPLELTGCLGLLEALYDCGLDQLDFLGQHCSTSLDHVEFPVFESVAKEALRESKALHAMPSFASTEYELEHAADRLIAITTILRNFSVPDSKNNHDMLNSEPSAKFVASIIRRVGSSPGILRTSRNLLDFMKDIVTLLSNVSHRLELLTQDDASAILHLLLAFTPADSPSMTDDGKLAFGTYDPRRHQYLPSAIDSLAKLLARDEPVRPVTNRAFFKAVFAEDRTVSAKSKLLTRTFALAVAPVPDRQAALLSRDKNAVLRMAQERNSFLSQGMLAADILSTMIQGADDELAQDWLASADAWAPSLLHLLMQLGFELNTSHQRIHQGRLVDFEAGGCSIIAQRGLGMLKRLSDKVDRIDGLKVEILGMKPDREFVLHAALASHFEPVSLKHLLGLSGFDG